MKNGSLSFKEFMGCLNIDKEIEIDTYQFTNHFVMTSRSK